MVAMNPDLSPSVGRPRLEEDEGPESNSGEASVVQHADEIPLPGMGFPEAADPATKLLASAIAAAHLSEVLQQLDRPSVLRGLGRDHPVHPRPRPRLIG